MPAEPSASFSLFIRLSAGCMPPSPFAAVAAALAGAIFRRLICRPIPALLFRHCRQSLARYCAIFDSAFRPPPTPCHADIERAAVRFAEEPPRHAIPRHGVRRSSARPSPPDDETPPSAIFMRLRCVICERKDLLSGAAARRAQAIFEKMRRHICQALAPYDARRLLKRLQASSAA